jgi:hypothetical protein
MRELAWRTGHLASLAMERTAVFFFLIFFFEKLALVV